MASGTAEAQGPFSRVHGVGTAHGAISILNATATGRGCSLAIDAPTIARWAPQAEWEWHGGTDDALARAVLDVLHGLGVEGDAAVDCQSPFPPSRGLKTSSAAATAMLRAGADACNVSLSPDELDALAVQAARAAGVTLTGALDDQVAVSRGGCHLTDNHAGRIIASYPVPAWHVAVWVPEPAIPKSQLVGIDAGSARAGAQAAQGLLEAGDIPAALSRNGEAFHELYEAGGLPVTRAPVDVAMRAGALGAGLSGTGPAVAAIFTWPGDLPHVAGGQWSWHQAVAR